MTEYGQALSARQIQVLRYLAEDLSYVEIGARLGITRPTVGGIVARIYLKLSVKDRLQALIVAEKQGLLDNPGP